MALLSLILTLAHIGIWSLGRPSLDQQSDCQGPQGASTEPTSVPRLLGGSCLGHWNYGFVQDLVKVHTKGVYDEGGFETQGVLDTTGYRITGLLVTDTNKGLPALFQRSRNLRM